MSAGIRSIGPAVAGLALCVLAVVARDAGAAGAVAFRTWEGGATHPHVEPGESAAAVEAGLASAMAGNPALWGSAWAHTGDWWSVHIHDAPAVRIRVEADDPAAFTPGLSVWAIGNAGPFDGGTTGFGDETSNAGFGTPHSFNAFGKLGDAGTLWMADGHGGNAREWIGYAMAGPSYAGPTGWGETIVSGVHDGRLTDDFVADVSGLVGAGFAELVLQGVSESWFAIYVGGTAHGLSGGAFRLTVSSVPEPGTALLVLLGVGALAGARRS